jgi:hypothetical protein
MKMNSFELGQIVITDAAQAVLTTMEIESLQLIARHRKHDWGDVPHESKQGNQRTLREGGALHSSYTLGTHVICVTTNPQRSLTTILLADEVVSNL